MSKRLPSLTSLRTFEAAARNLSFARAADELFVTPAAVGFQIKQLEEELGGPLFIRKHRAIELTDKGQVLQKSLGQVFETIQAAWDEAHEPLQETVLKVSGPARAVHSWVMPALSAAKSQRPDLRVSWDLSKQNRDIASGKIDMAIRWALEPEADLHWEPLLRTWFTPIVRPDVARFVRRPADLLKQGLIDVEFATDPGNKQSTWATWFRVNGLDAPTDYAVTCADTASAVDSAIATGHVAIGGSFLASEHLRSGALVAPFKTAIAPFSRFWLVCRKDLASTPEHQWFLDAAWEGSAAFDELTKDMELFHPDGSLVAN
ncbi:LysR substrate-binding domain-containing protein [Ruegeria sp. HKCCD7255]|uniref:LysR substrate-binding domain-containing protein n=1 Tax=Ruegeria sp. HKCCD7255 TaxID=2683004 RepID=UPI001489B721|nr:LysR substrate-binding domain-containing protein [Ruegeria sp. HKCCD7255]